MGVLCSFMALQFVYIHANGPLTSSTAKFDILIMAGFVREFFGLKIH